MKLRIKGNSLRLRVSQSELARLMRVGCIQGTMTRKMPMPSTNPQAGVVCLEAATRAWPFIS